MVDKPVLYLGGPVDYATHDTADAWQHWPVWNRLGIGWCPRCRCEGMADEAIIESCYRSVTTAPLAIMDLRTHSIGTPIELYWRAWGMELPTIIVAKEGSVFIRETARRFHRVVVTTSIHQAPYIAEEILNGTGTHPSPNR